ncbi:hypothetical protein A0256_02230 [Mucilaginibacter sp. PAMC 26640]|nr:hypothetical protein A0256_02230 [Mucilaginibacter sp. PAMC 26640]
MRLLADANISWRLKKLLPYWHIFPVDEIDLSSRASDFTIFQFAKANELTILTFDEDFLSYRTCIPFHQK